VFYSSIAGKDHWHPLLQIILEHRHALKTICGTSTATSWPRSPSAAKPGKLLIKFAGAFKKGNLKRLGGVFSPPIL
jgi:hypothetical protein